MGMGERRHRFGLACLLAMLGGLPASVVSGTVSADPAPTLTNALGMTFRLIPGGSFQMGCDPATATAETCHSSEQPAHRVTLAPFYLADTEVTQRQWTAVMAANPAHFQDPDRPVEQVSWEDAQAFVQALNRRPELGGGYRLPSEAEWEYAARAGTTTAYWFGQGADDAELKLYLWYLFSSGEQTHPVAEKPPNPWGLYDILGNVLEWVSDGYHPDYVGAPSDGQSWDADGQRLSNGRTVRILRGGAWYLYPNGARAAFRFHYDPTVRHYGFGVRLARSIPTTDPDAKMAEVEPRLP